MHFVSFASVRRPAYRLAVSCWLLIAAVSCQKKSADPSPSSGLSAAILNIVPAAVLDDMRAKGLVVNGGSEPPKLEGIYLESPNVLVSPYGPDDSQPKGKTFSDYKYRFYDQNGTTVKIDAKATNGTEVTSGVGALVAGSGSKFTIFAQQKGVSSGIETTELSVFSGEVTADGITGFQYAFTLTDKKNDVNDDLLPVGKSRVFADGDGIARRIGTFRMGVSDAPETSPSKATFLSSKTR